MEEKQNVFNEKISELIQDAKNLNEMEFYLEDFLKLQNYLKKVEYELETENDFSEEDFNQIKTKIEILKKRLKPIVPENVSNDDFEILFEEQENFQKFILNRHNDLEWNLFNIYEAKFTSIESGPLFLEETKEKFNLSDSDEAVLSTICVNAAGISNGSGLLMTRKKGKTLISSLMSIVAKQHLAEILTGSTRIMKMSNFNFQETIPYFQTIKNEQTTRFLKSFGKIRAFLSADKGSRSYSVINQKDQLEAILASFDKRFPNYKFVYGYFNHDATKARWSFPEQKEELLKTYSLTAGAAGIVGVMDLIPSIRWTTSDTAKSSVQLHAELMSDKGFISIGNMIKIPHLYNNDIPQLNAELDNLFVQFGDMIKNLENLIRVEVKHPLSCLKNLAKDCGFTNTIIDVIVDKFSSYYGEDEFITAHDIFFALQEGIFEMGMKDGNEVSIDNIRENITRIINPSFEWKYVDVE